MKDVRRRAPREETFVRWAQEAGKVTMFAYEMEISHALSGLLRPGSLIDVLYLTCVFLTSTYLTRLYGLFSASFRHEMTCLSSRTSFWSSPETAGCLLSEKAYQLTSYEICVRVVSFLDIEL